MESAVTVVCSKEYVNMPMADRITDLVERIRRMEDKRRSKNEMSTIIASGVAIAAEHNEVIARMFLASHQIHADTIERVMSGGYRKTDI